MGLTKKVTCNRCLANKNGICELGYKAIFYSLDGKKPLGIPKEICPKPLMKEDLLYARKYLKIG